MESFEDRYFRFIRIMLSFLGIWHTQTYKERLIRYYFICSTYFYSLLAELCQFFILDHDLQSVVFILQIFISATCFAVAYFTCILHYATIQQIYCFMKQDWRQSKESGELQIMKKHADESKLFVWICTVTCFFFLSLYILPPVLRKVLFTNEVAGSMDRFPMISCLDYFLDPETYYYPTIIYQTVMLSIGSMAAIFCYSIYFSLIQHICARLCIVKDKINQPFTSNLSNDDVYASTIDFSHWMVDIIRYLTRTTKLMSLTNGISETCYLFQISLVFFLVIVNFVCMPLLLEYKENKKDMIAIIVFSFGTIFPLYVNCFIGQRLMDYSTDVHREICLIPIHAISLKTQKLMLTTLMMSAKPYQISIGKMFVASHEFFSDLLRISLSFAMVVHSTQKV